MRDADAEFARSLSQVDQAGGDLRRYPDIVDLLGPERMQRLMTPTDPPSVPLYQPVQIASTAAQFQANRARPSTSSAADAKPPSQSPTAKGKRKADDAELDVKPDVKPVLDVKPRIQAAPVSPPSECSICMEPFRAVFDPQAETARGSSSTALKAGLLLPRCRHPFCGVCLSRYVSDKVTDRAAARVFPIRCPACPRDASDDLHIGEDVAKRVLDAAAMVQFHERKLLDSLPGDKFYCPNPTCSELLLRHDASDTRTMAQCPACRLTSVSENRLLYIADRRNGCFECRVAWHDDLSCAQYQALPADQRRPEDRALVALAKQKNWRACPGCAVHVELTSGCHHITCRCGAEWCFVCGSTWSKDGSCPKGCPLWEERRLLDEDARAQADRDDRLAAGRQALDFLSQGIGRNRFSMHMVNTTSCGYCLAGFQTRHDLVNHLLRPGLQYDDLLQHRHASRHAHYDELVRNVNARPVR